MNAPLLGCGYARRAHAHTTRETCVATAQQVSAVRHWLHARAATVECVGSKHTRIYICMYICMSSNVFLDKIDTCCCSCCCWKVYLRTHIFFSLALNIVRKYSGACVSMCAYIWSNCGKEIRYCSLSKRFSVVCARCVCVKYVCMAVCVAVFIPKRIKRSLLSRLKGQSTFNVEKWLRMQLNFIRLCFCMYVCVRRFILAVY